MSGFVNNDLVFTSEKSSSHTPRSGAAATEDYIVNSWAPVWYADKTSFSPECCIQPVTDRFGHGETQSHARPGEIDAIPTQKAHEGESRSLWDHDALND